MATETVSRSRKTEPTPEDRDRAKAFAEWQKRARERMGWNIPRLAHASSYSDTQIRLYDADGYAGIDSTGRYRQPKREYVEAIGKATRLHADSINEGLQAAGLLLQTGQLPVSESDMRPVSLSTGEIIYLRPDEPDPENTVRALEAFLTGYRAGKKRPN